jgi:hypothetical protein
MYILHIFITNAPFCKGCKLTRATVHMEEGTHSLAAVSMPPSTAQCWGAAPGSTFQPARISTRVYMHMSGMHFKVFINVYIVCAHVFVQVRYALAHTHIHTSTHASDAPAPLFGNLP